jgi:hypothetical protein
MKKIILTVAAVFALTFANAQDLKSKKGENYLPEAGDWAISFNANGIFEYVGNAFSGSTAKNAAPSVNFARANSFVGKKFIDAKTAYRVVANLRFDSEKTTPPGTPQPNPTSSSDSKTSGFDLAVGLGKEWRRGNTRLQGFYGADALLTLASTSTKTTASSPGFTSSTETKSGLGLGVGMQGFIGAEYFIFPKMSIGAQYTYRVGVDIQGKGERTTSATGQPTVTTTTGNKTSKFGIGGVDVASINLTLHF